MNVALLVPPAIDWNMPLIALPLLKSYLPRDWNVKVFDINAMLFSSEFNPSTLAKLKKFFLKSIESRNLTRAVDACLDIEDHITLKEIASARLQGRSLYVINDWFCSDKVYEYLQKQHGLTCLLGDLLEECISMAQEDVFGISITIEEQIIPSFILCSEIRKKYPKSKIVLGGNIVSRLCDNLLNSHLKHLFDLLVTGEGEAILKDAMEYVVSSKWEEEKIYCFKQSKDTNFFNNLKTPDFSDIVWSNYLSPVKILPITVQRKCRWGKCDFCAIHSCWTCSAHDRKVSDVVQEIKKYVYKFNVTHFRIIDEMVSAEYLYELSSQLIKTGIHIFYEAYVRFEKRFSDLSYIKKIFEGGCRQLFWGLENINDSALKLMNKGTTKLLIDECLDAAQNVGIMNYCFVLMGIPKVPLETECETIEYVQNNTNIHVGIVGSFVIDRLSPIHIEEKMHKKYDITLFEIGDLTTEVGYLSNNIDERHANKQRTSKYIKYLYSKRPDYAICSLLSEEERFILTSTFGNSFAFDYIKSISEEKKLKLVDKSVSLLIGERVSRKKGKL